jgi:hypothetical protein
VRVAMSCTLHCSLPCTLHCTLNYTLHTAQGSHRLRGAGEAELVAEACLGLVGVALDQVGHGAARAPAVHHLRRAVVRVQDVGPGDVAEEFTSLKLLHRLAQLGWDCSAVQCSAVQCSAVQCSVQG